MKLGTRRRRIGERRIQHRGSVVAEATNCQHLRSVATRRRLRRLMIAESARSSPRISSRPPAADSGTIEIAIADAVVRVIGQAETEAIVAVLRALRRVS
jgi:hypothetical protein